MTIFDTDRRPAAEAKRLRKDAIRAALATVDRPPTNHPGADFARADIRRMDRRARNRKPDPGSATAAKKRLDIARGDGPKPGVRSDKRSVRLSPVPEGFFSWSKAKRRKWASDREVSRQSAEIDSLIRRGIPFDVARQRFGCFAGRAR